MKLALQITFKNMDPSQALEADIREKAEKLERFCNQIISCRVVIDAQSHRHRRGNLFRVHVSVKVPDREIVASHGGDEEQQHEDAYVAIRDAFDHVRRQIEDYNKRQQQL